MNAFSCEKLLLVDEEKLFGFSEKVIHQLNPKFSWEKARKFHGEMNSILKMKV